jgi:hypothetical protein
MAITDSYLFIAFTRFKTARSYHAVCSHHKNARLTTFTICIYSIYWIHCIYFIIGLPNAANNYPTE